jgi:hypothetical protein
MRDKLYASDIFSNVAEQFDLIMFDLWHRRKIRLALYLVSANRPSRGSPNLARRSLFFIRNRSSAATSSLMPSRTLGRWGRRAVQLMMLVSPTGSLVALHQIDGRCSTTAVDLRTVVREQDSAYLDWTARRF